MAVQLEKWRFTVDEYHKMLDAGILDEDDRVELIEGEIVEMAPIRMRHAMCVARLVDILGEQVRRRAIVWPQNSLILNDGTEFQPDIALLRLRDYSMDELAPRADDVMLVIEVSDSTVSKDRQVKAPLYALSAIPQYWLVNLPRGIVEVYSNPAAGTYRGVRHAKRNDSLELSGFPGVTIKVEDILGD